MAGANEFTIEQFLDAIPGTGGIIATIAKRVGCNWHTAQKYIKRYATIQKAYQDECATIDDMAVSVVIKAIQQGEDKDLAVQTSKWWLAKKRRSEFGDQIDVNTTGVVIKVIRADQDDQPK